MNQKAFTLIELLVVVAIIGILAAVGVVAYDGYTASAKASATKANFKMMQRYMTAEVAKCDLGETSIMKRDDGSSINCSQRTEAKIIPHLQQLFNIEKKLISVYTKKTYVRNTGSSSNSSSIGSIHLNGVSHDKTFNPGASPSLNNNDIRITSCFKEPCSSSENNLSHVINID